MAVSVTETVEPPVMVIEPPVTEVFTDVWKLSVTVTAPVGAEFPPIVILPMSPEVVNVTEVPPSIVEFTLPWPASVTTTAPDALESATPPIVETVWFKPPTSVTVPDVSLTVMSVANPAVRKSLPCELVTLTAVRPVQLDTSK